MSEISKEYLMKARHLLRPKGRCIVAVEWYGRYQVELSLQARKVGDLT